MCLIKYDRPGKLRAKYDRYLDGSSPSVTSSEAEEGGHRANKREKSLYDIIGADSKATVEEIKEAAQGAVSLFVGKQIHRDNR